MKNTAPYDNAPPATLAFKTGENQSEMVAADKPLPSQLYSGGVPVNMSPPQCLGEYVLTVDATNAGNDLATLLGGTVLADAINGNVAGLPGFKLSFILATVETQDVRVSFKDNDPTSNGLLFAKGNAKPYCWDTNDFTKMRLVGQGGAASVKVALFA